MLPFSHDGTQDTVSLIQASLTSARWLYHVPVDRAYCILLLGLYHLPIASRVLHAGMFHRVKKQPSSFKTSIFGRRQLGLNPSEHIPHPSKHSTQRIFICLDNIYMDIWIGESPSCMPQQLSPSWALLLYSWQMC